jgi:hypothetical protein
MPEIYQSHMRSMNPSYSDWNQPELQRQMFNAQNSLDWDKMMGDYNTRQRQSDIEQQRADTEKLLGQQKLTNEMALAGGHNQNQLELARIKTEADKHLYDKNLVTQMIAGGMSAGTPFADIEDNVGRAKDLALSGKPSAGVAPSGPVDNSLRVYGTRAGTTDPITYPAPSTPAAPPPAAGPAAPPPMDKKQQRAVEDASKRTTAVENPAAVKGGNETLTAQQFLNRLRMQRDSLRTNGGTPEQEQALIKQVVGDMGKGYIDFNKAHVGDMLNERMVNYGVPEIGGYKANFPLLQRPINSLRSAFGLGPSPGSMGASLRSWWNPSGFNKDAEDGAVKCSARSATCCRSRRRVTCPV